MKEKLKAASAQFQHQPGDKEANFRKIENWLDEAEKEQAMIVVFPEMCITGYWHVRSLSREEIANLAEPVPGGPPAGAPSNRGLRLKRPEYHGNN